MYAHKTRARVESGHRITVELPSDFPTGDVEVIVLPAAGDSEDELTEIHAHKVTVDELIAARLTPPPGVGPVSLADIERAIAEGALGRAVP